MRRRPFLGSNILRPLAVTLTCLAPVFVAAQPGADALAQSGAGARLYKSGPIQISADGRWVWVANGPADVVTRIDASSGSSSLFRLPGGPGADNPRGLAVTEDGSTVWVAAHDTDRVYVVDGSSGAVSATFQMPWGSGPVSVALSPPGRDGRQAWALVALHRGSALAAIATDTKAVTLLEPVFHSPFGIAFADDGASAWVTHLFVEGEHPHLSRVDFTGAEPVVAAHFNAFAADPRHSSQLTDADPDRNVAEGGYLNFRGHPAFLPASTGVRQLWLPTQYHNMTEDRPSPDSTIQASLRKLELATSTVSGQDKVVLTARHVHDPTRGGNNPPWLGYGWNATVSGLVDIAFVDSGGLHAVLVAEQSNEIVVLKWDTPPFKSASDPDAPGLPELRVGDRPLGIAVSPSEPRAFVFNGLSFDVSVVDLSDPGRPRETGRIDVGRPAPGELLAGPDLLAGAKLFFSSADPRLSGNEKVACASCHINGEHDGRSWSFQHLPPGTAGQGHGPRSTPSMLGIGRTFTAGARDSQHGYGLLHRSGDRDEVQDFEHTLQGPHMGGTGLLGPTVQSELGPANAGRSPDLDRLAAFVEALPALQRSPARDASGGLTEAAARGATYFTGIDGSLASDAACAGCHIPETFFQDGTFHDVGQRRDAGEAELNDRTRRGGCLWCVATPTLVGAWSTFPYDGLYRWAGSMEEVLVDFADPARPAAHGRTTGLTGRQLMDLAEFVTSIDGSTTALEVRSARDTIAPRVARIAVTSPSQLEVWYSETVDAASAEEPANYRLIEEPSGRHVPVTGAVWSAQNGDRVTLTVDGLQGGGVAYRLELGGDIRDAAGTVSGGAANHLDPADPANRPTFALTETLSITLGASGYENLTIAVHDVSPVGPGLSTWAHDRVFPAQLQGNAVPGFVRFDWRDAFVGATGVARAADILDARFSLHGEAGEAQTLALHRVLQPWRDSPGGGDWNQNPVGAPTWRDHAHPDGRWNRPGAAARGGSGDRRGDYNGQFDLAETADALVRMPAVNTRTTFSGQGITEAFRFWFAEHDLDYGYALTLRHAAPAQIFARFMGWEQALHAHGPVLTITYRLPAPGAEPTPTAGQPTERVYLPQVLK